MRRCPKPIPMDPSNDPPPTEDARDWQAQRDALRQLHREVLDEATRHEGDRFDDAAEIFREVTLRPEFPAFLTLPAYSRYLTD